MCLQRAVMAVCLFFITPAVLFAKPATDMPPGLQAAYQKARHQIEIIEEKGRPTRWRAVNASNHLNINFDGKGILARSFKDDWHLSMELAQLGELNHLKPVNKPSVQIKNNRLTYDRGTIKEWYINDPKGIEQGFTLAKPLAKEQLVLQFKLGGDTRPKLVNKGKTLQLITPQGKKLRYEGLKAWDAKGRDLNATIQLKENDLQLLVAVANATYPITIDPWLVEEQKLTASDRAAGDLFGSSVAISGNTAVVGAYGDDGKSDFSGSAYIFTDVGNGNWSQQAKLVALDATAGAYFGYSVAISGNTVVVGAYRDSDGSGNSGSAYIFTDIGNGDWREQAKLLGSDATQQDNFGYSVAISGNTAVVGAIGDDVGGSAYIFTHIGSGNWHEQAKLIASDAAAVDWFGCSVAISGDTAVVGNHRDQDGGNLSGSAYIFTDLGHGNWSQQAKLLASDAAAYDYFGQSVSISGDTVIVGAHLDDDGSNDSGAAYIFTHVGNGDWFQQAKLLASDPSWDDRFGWSVAISGDTAVVGAFLDDDVGESSGSAYKFTRDNNGDWRQQAKLLASDAVAHVNFGYSVAISGDQLVVGANGDDGGGRNSGSAYIFDLGCSTTYTLATNQWHQISLPCDPGQNNTVAAVFGDDITADYGTHWVLYQYSGSGYVKLESPATNTLSQGVGYWIIQNSGDDIILDMPNNSTPASVSHPTGCLDTAKGCFEILLATKNTATQWSMIGYPFKATRNLKDMRVLTYTDTSPCPSGCELDSQNIVHNQLWTYDGTAYTLVNTSGDLDPWTGYWSATLSNADGTYPKLLVPKP